MSVRSVAKAIGASWWPDRRDIDAIVLGRHANPFAVLGPHQRAEGRLVISVFAPGADEVDAVEAESGALIGKLERLHQDGFFCGCLPGPLAGGYRLLLRGGGDSWTIDDPYRFPSSLAAEDRRLFAEGRHESVFDMLGAHLAKVEGVSGTRFAVWAPNASRVSVVGPFNFWDGRRHPMRCHPDSGIWEIFLPAVDVGELYKFELLAADGRLLPAKSDPFGQAQELPPATASRVVELDDGRGEHDRIWMQQRARRQNRSVAISIYEVHLGSWRRGPGDCVLDYDQIADELIPYIRDLGFTHVELMPIAEYPFGGSWGYQPTGLYAPTARFGSPADFARFIDRFHEAGLGVILDWVPGHFPSDAHGLARFDGTALFEHEDPRRGVHRDWNTLIYNYGRREVANFLEANALFWLEHYHLDGLRVDAVASMLYLDYSRAPGEWLPNAHNGRENLEAVAFLRGVNERIRQRHPGAITVAEESTAWPMVSRPVDAGGLGFSFKWNMGWMHDTLVYISNDPVHRRYHHDKLTFGLIYAFNEDFVLPISHDEVVHGKGSLLGKMPGDRWQKFANVRAYLAFMWAHPGKKLLFMGSEFAQEREWNHDRSLDWHELDDPLHRGVQSLVRDLNRLYRSEPALHQLDCEAAGFMWIDAGNAQESVLVFCRMGENNAAPVVVVCNFTPVVREAYRIGVPEQGRWSEALNSDAAHYGGSNVGNLGGVTAQGPGHHGQPYSVTLTLPPLSVVMLIAQRQRKEDA